VPKQLIPLSVASPGFFGLNKQQGSSILPPGWASEATNLVYDDTGRLASREGYKNIFSSNPTGTPKAIHEYVDAAGSRITIFATNNTIYKDDADGTFTDISGSITTPTADNWKFQNFNGACVGYQTGHDPIALTTVGGTFIDGTGTQYAGNTVLASNGRLWTVFDNTLYYSDLLINTYAGGSSGSFDLATYWREGMDEAVAITEFNGYLVVFGKDNIIVYSNPDDPTSSMAIVENIGGIGCVARDSVQDIGTDLLFLSRTGIRSLGRTIQEKSSPIRDISKNIKDYIIQKYSIETGDIKSVYNSEDGFYAISFPSNSKTFVFDLKLLNQDGTPKVTEWDIAPTALAYTITADMLMGFTTRVSEYTGYLDDVARDDSGGATYSVEWVGNWNDFGQEVSSLVKIPKKMSILMGGVAGRTVSIKWAYDYIDSFSSTNITFTSGTVARYGVATYTNGIYSGLLTFNTAKTPLQSSGQVMKFGIEASVNGEQIILQRLDILAKIGRYAL